MSSGQECPAIPEHKNSIQSLLTSSSFPAGTTRADTGETLNAGYDNDYKHFVQDIYFHVIAF
jgi:hypothetical protein